MNDPLVIYPVDRAIRSLNNWGQRFRDEKTAALIFTVMSYSFLIFVENIDFLVYVRIFFSGLDTRVFMV